MFIEILSIILVFYQLCIVKPVLISYGNAAKQKAAINYKYPRCSEHL